MNKDQFIEFFGPKLTSAYEFLAARSSVSPLKRLHLEDDWLAREKEFNDKNHRTLTEYESEIAEVAIESKGEDFVAVVQEKYSESYLVKVIGCDTETYTTRGYRTYCLRLATSPSGLHDEVLSLQRIDFLNIPTPSSELSEVSTFSTWTWSSSDAAAYSNRHATNRNSDYRDYDNDCTNFVSQCLAAGGKVERDGDRVMDPYWFYGTLTFTTSYTWAGAQNLKRHLANHTNSTVHANALDLRVGDVVVMEPTSSSLSWHAMVVGRKTSSDLLMNYHTNDTYQKSLSLIKSQNPNYTYHHIKIGDRYS